MLGNWTATEMGCDKEEPCLFQRVHVGFHQIQSHINDRFWPQPAPAVVFKVSQVPKDCKTGSWKLWKQRTFHKCSAEPELLVKTFEKLKRKEKYAINAEKNRLKGLEIAQIIHSAVAKSVPKGGDDLHNDIHDKLDELAACIDDCTAIDLYKKIKEAVPQLEAVRPNLINLRHSWDRHQRKYPKYAQDVDKYLSGKWEPESWYKQEKLKKVASVKENYAKAEKKLLEEVNKVIDNTCYLHTAECTNELEDIKSELLALFRRFAQRHRTPELANLYASLFKKHVEGPISVAIP